jgi:hypothetical protein
MREIKFEYIVKYHDSDETIKLPYSLDQLEETTKLADLRLNGRVIARRQYTGLKDIANVEIYEGDIVAYDTEDGVCIAEVEWSQDVDPNRDMSPILGPGYVLTNARHWHDYKEGEDAVELLVVGDIYRNPELLEQSQ